MAKHRSDYLKQKEREFYVLPPGHISVVLVSNSGNVPLADTKVLVVTAKDRLEGTTDKDGYVAFERVPIGEYKMLLPDLEATVVVPSVPTDVEKLPVCVAGFELFGKEPKVPSDVEESDDGLPSAILRQKAKSDGWEEARR